MRPYDSGNVILISQVELIGRQSSLVKHILGVVSKPTAGSLEAPVRNSRMFEIDTSPSERGNSKTLQVLNQHSIITLQGETYTGAILVG